jgi:hypothetical protein
MAKHRVDVWAVEGEPDRVFIRAVWVNTSDGYWPQDAIYDGDKAVEMVAYYQRTADIFEDHRPEAFVDPYISVYSKEATDWSAGWPFHGDDERPPRGLVDEPPSSPPTLRRVLRDDELPF